MIQSKLKISKIIGVSCFYLGVSLIGVVAMYYPTLLSGFTRIQAELGDTRLVQYFLEHSFQVVSDRHYVGSLWSPPFFYPFQNALALSENLFGTAPIYWALRSSLDTDHAYQAWIMIVTWLCFVGFVVMLRQLRVGHGLSALGGFLFAFGLPRAAKIGHFQLFPQFFLPFAVLSVWNFVQKPTLKQFCWLLLLIYWQLLSGLYLGWFLIFSLLLFVPALLYLERSAIDRLLQYFKLHWKSSAIALAVWFGATLWLYLPYARMGGLAGERPYSEVADMLPRLTSWLLPAPQSSWGRVLSRLGTKTPMVHEHWLFIGFVVLGLVGVAIYTLRSRSETISSDRRLLATACFITCLGIFLLSLSVFKFSLWWFIYKLLPGATSIRAVTRISLTFYCFLLLGTLLCVDSLLKSTVAKPSVRTAIAISLLLLTLPEQIVWNAPSFDRLKVRSIESELQEVMSKGCNFAYVEIRPDDTFYSQQIYAMWAGLRANVPVINGYSGANPQGLEMRRNVQPPELLQWLNNSKQSASGRLCLIQNATAPLSTPSAIETFNSSAGHFSARVILVSPPPSREPTSKQL